MNETVKYKGKTYRLLWRGLTKFGRRAHLEAIGGSFDFWAPLAGVEIQRRQGPKAKPYVRRCSFCHCDKVKSKKRSGVWWCPKCQKDAILHERSKDTSDRYIKKVARAKKEFQVERGSKYRAGYKFGVL